MGKINILVLGVGGNVSQGILKALETSDIDYNLIGACIDSDSAGLYLCNKAYICPLANTEEFIPWLINICNQEEIHIVFTGVEENICKIAENYEEFSSKTNAIFKCTDYDKLMIGQDKWLTCKWLEENGCNYPEYCRSEDSKEIRQLVEKVGYPIIAKPRKGKGSQGIIVINKEEEIKKLEDLTDYVVQECVGTNKTEYTVGCYCDKDGKLIDTIIMKRELKQGATYKAEVIQDNVIDNEVRKICELFKPVGPLNIQLRVAKDGRPICFELNVRFSGTTPMRAHFGYNDVAAMVKEYVFDEDIKNEFNVKPGIAYRYLNEVYVQTEIVEAIRTNGTVQM